ncbi:MAG TPA: GNAT family N-acetyltransferase [Planctomycetota bacterium]|nr:GNAT family N-acetyltransferase [Planctomycetota bacterium]
MTTAVIAAATAEEIPAARTLFEEYARWLQVDLCFQGFGRELAELPGRYAPPGGRLLLAHADGEIAGCVALRAIGDGLGEVKRLYVRERWRGIGLGRRLMEAAIAEARAAGHSRLRLDTLPKMATARALYAAMGFREIAPYYESPIEGTSFLELAL